MTEPSAPSLPKALAQYTALRLGIFALCFVVAAAVILPSISASKPTQILLCALVAAVVSVPVSLFFGRKLRSRVTAALLAGRVAREAKDAEYDARVRAVREQNRAAGKER